MDTNYDPDSPSSRNSSPTKSCTTFPVLSTRFFDQIVNSAYFTPISNPAPLFFQSIHQPNHPTMPIPWCTKFFKDISTCSQQDKPTSFPQEILSTIIADALAGHTQPYPGKLHFLSGTHKVDSLAQNSFSHPWKQADEVLPSDSGIKSEEYVREKVFSSFGALNQDFCGGSLPPQPPCYQLLLCLKFDILLNPHYHSPGLTLDTFPFPVAVQDTFLYSTTPWYLAKSIHMIPTMGSNPSFFLRSI